ncbi:MAG TPA: hypothetical protein VFP68_02090 [Burkholderiaceae bacterium]|nr:hypothetical protein [Burkholderiaceae bacterium]
MQISSIVSATIAAGEAHLADNIGGLVKPPIDVNPGHPPVPDPTSAVGLKSGISSLRSLADTVALNPQPLPPKAGGNGNLGQLLSRLIDDCGTVPRHWPKGFPPPPPPHSPFTTPGPQLPAQTVAFIGNNVFRPR